MVRNAAFEIGMRKAVASGVEVPWGFSKPDTKNVWGPPQRHTPQAAQCWFPANLLKHPKESCNVPPRAFAIIYLDEHRQLQCETSPWLSTRKEDIFKRRFCQTFQDAVEQEERHLHLEGNGPSREAKTIESRGYSETSNAAPSRLVRRTAKKKLLSSKTAQSSMKRRKSRVPKQLSLQWSASRGLHSSSSDDDEQEPDEFAGVRTVLKEIVISDEEALSHFYDTRFRQIQQLSLKTIAKAWIKVVQPKKQAHHPYNGGKQAKEVSFAGNGEVTKPDWWPPQGCRHREPDHIKKPERLILMQHILRNLTYRGITCEILESSTNEILGTIKDQRHRDWLQDIYNVRKTEERFLRDEIDADYIIHVESPDQNPKTAHKKPKSVRRHIRSRVSVPHGESSTPIVTSSSSQQQSPSVLVSPISNMDVHPPQREQIFNKLPRRFHGDSDRGYQAAEGGCWPPPQIVSEDAPFLPNNTRSAQQYVSPPPAISYIEPSAAHYSNDLSFISRESSHFAPSESVQASYLERSSQTYLPIPPQEAPWPAPSAAQTYQNQTGWSYAPPPVNNPQVGFPALLQHPLATSPNVHLLPAPLRPTLPDLSNPPGFSQSFDNEYSATGLRTGSLGRLHHGLPDYQNF